STPWSFTTLGTAPASPVLATPTNNAVDISVSPTLTWNASTTATSYTLQVSTKSDFSSFVYNQSVGNLTSQQITGLSNLTPYYWKVSATNSYGTSAYSTPWSFTTLGTAPASPVLATPTNNAVDISVSPTLTWNASATATSYTLQVSTKSDFSSFVYNQSVGNLTSQQITGLSNSTPYYWRVSATNSYGTSSWSTPIWSFTTLGTPPASPVLATPTNNAVDISVSPTLTWNASATATSYTLQVSTQSDFSSFVYNQSVGNLTSRQITGLSNLTPYYWKVSATNSYGTSAYSTPWSFTTLGTAPASPVLATPTNNAVDISVSPTLTWNASATATSYTLQVSTQSNFSSFVYNQNGLTSTNQQVTGLSNLTPYYWKVSATNSYGTSAYSTPWSFTTLGTAPASPVLATPTNNAVDISVSPTLTWNASATATSYTLQVSAQSDFSSFVYNQSVGNLTSRQITGLSNLTPYYWKVSATNSYDTSAYSTPWSFTTLGTAPASPVLATPTNNVVDISVSPTLTWNASATATSYTLQVSTQSNFSSFVYNQSVGNLTSQQITGLSNLTPYYWKVSATNSYGTSAYSTPWSFTTLGTAPASPTLATPTNNAVDISVSPTLTWNASATATSYTLQVSTQSNFSSFVYNQSVGNVTSQQITGLSNSTPYYWRVSATNSYGTSSWSTPIWSFTILGTPPAAPTLATPANSAVDVAISPTLTWNASATATSYTLQVSTKSDFSSFVYNQSVGNLTSPQITGLSNSTPYYWRVSAINSYGTSSWSTPIWSFTTIGQSASLTGYAYYAGTTIPVSGVIVTIYNQSATTGSDGKYTLSNLIEGQRTLQATKSGYDSYSNMLILVAGVNTLNIEMTSALYTHNLTGTIVSSDNNQPLAEVTITVLNDDGTNSQLVTTSDFTGYYQVPTVPQGQRKVTFSKQRYFSYTTQIFMSNSDYKFNVQLNPSFIMYDGKAYNIIIIGTQYWLKENLDVGTMIIGSADASNNSTIEKYCYDNNAANCTTYGGLYQWNEAMAYSTTPGTKGICPTGWHIPTKAELQTLATAVNNDGNALKEVGQGTGNGAGTNASGFSALLVGYRTTNGHFGDLGVATTFWSSTEYDATSAYILNLNYYDSGIYLGNDGKEYGFRIRCLKD
ncbi:MAG: carboxypeptidase regulatory-like domain-containing protein, partial [Ignavibacteriaceae bacterium]|nr:carboxypeptidase regulatory-like domain-containing protein [Ignavibacteriaceae bacterium]